MGLGARSHDYRRSPGGVDFCFRCWKHYEPGAPIECPAYRADYDPEVLRDTIKQLTRAIEAEGYDVLVDVDGTYSVRLREPT